MNILGIFIVPLFGYLITSAIWQKKSLLENLAYGYLIGWPLFTLALFIANLLGLRFATIESSLVLSSLLFIVIILRFIFRVPLNPNQHKINFYALTRLETVIFITIALLLITIFINSLYAIVVDWDSLTLYDFRARLFAQYGGMQEAIRAQGSYFNSYPPHTSLVHMWYYLLGFHSPMTYYGGLLISFVTAFYFSARRVSSRTISLLSSLMLVLAPHIFWHSQIAYTNLPYTVSLVMGTILIVEWVRTNKFSNLALGALLTGISVWIRHPEPFWMTNLLIVVAVSIYKRKPWLILPYSIIFFPFERIWKVFVAGLAGASASGSLSEVSGGLATVTKLSNMSVIMDVIQYLATTVARPYAPAFALFGFMILLKYLQRDKFWVAEFIVITNLALLSAGTLIFAMTQPYWQEIPGSLQRVSMIFTPLILYSFASMKRSR